MITLAGKSRLIRMLSLTLLLLAGHVPATPIYKSIDADGNVTYSSQPPREAVTVEKMILNQDDVVTPSAQSQANMDAIKQTADQLEMQRKQREQERQAAREKADAQAQDQAKPPPETVIYYYPVFPFYYYPGPFTPRPHPPRPRPRHPPGPGTKTAPASPTQAAP
jgi:tRNA A37 threonylcarbamoyladenosine modification protein TsaB